MRKRLPYKSAAAFQKVSRRHFSVFESIRSSDNFPVVSLLKRAVTGLFMLVLGVASPARADSSIWASAPKPDFPKAELSKGTEGYVVVNAYINAAGAVTRVTITKSSGHPV